MGGYTIWFDLADQIVSKFKSVYDKGFSDDYLSNSYSSKLSVDPFGDAMSNIENRTEQLRIAWVQYVEESLQKKWCNLSKKKIYWILYYFVPEFRVELVRDLKQSMWDYDSRKYALDEKNIEKYCEEYFVCSKKNITTSENVLTNCKEFFQQNYKAGQDNKGILQNVEAAWVWSDKYWNNSVEDSPYDIMVDMGVLAKLLYQEVQDPIKPVFYKLPLFSNSLKSSNANNDTNSSSSSMSFDRQLDNEVDSDNHIDVTGKESGALWNGSVSLKNDNLSNQSYKTELNWIDEMVTIQPLSDKVDIRGWYDELVEWLNSYRFGNAISDFYTNICEDEDDWSELEPEMKSENIWDGMGTDDEDDFDNLSDKEYQEIIDSLWNAVNQYVTYPKEIEDKINQQSDNISDGILNSTTASELEETAKQIKDCYDSCKGLRIDQKASCMLKCSCWEIKSPIFDPNVTPWLWPIFVIRFCGVPAVNTNFSVWWKRIHSIEEWVNEIFWVVDKLSREWKLWKWTQQHEFLDSSTKQTNIANTFAFTIDVELVDIMKKSHSQSEQFRKKEKENFNENAQKQYWILNSLSDPSRKNAYRICGADLWSLKSEVEYVVDLVEDARANRYSVTEESFADRMDQQATLWKKIEETLLLLKDYSETLNSKTCPKS